MRAKRSQGKPPAGANPLEEANPPDGGRQSEREGFVRRGFLITLGAIIIIGVVIFMWWLPAYREAELQRQMAAIESMENLTERKEAALNFLVDNQMADREILLRALDAAADEFRESEDKQPLIDLYQGLYDEGLTPWLRYRIMARLDRGLVETGTEESVARAEELARELLQSTDAPSETYHWMVYFHQRSEMTNPELTVAVALAAEKATDREEYGMWPQMLSMAYGNLIGSVKEEQGLDAALSKATLHMEQTDNPQALAAINAAVFSVTVDEDQETAIAAAQAIADLEGLTGSDPSNRIAYDMAERGLAPDIAVRLGLQALAHASSRYDSTMVLDTVGWAYYAAGEHGEAASYLRSAVDMMDETLTYDNETVQHLLTAYETGGMLDDTIDLLALMAARAVDADDPARRELAAKLVERDGNADAMEELVAGLRYAGVKMAPAFALNDRDGNRVALEDLRGEILVLNFWSYG
jgi:hypothetical protein